MHTDAGVSGKSLVRPALTAALADLDAGHGNVLMVSKLDRLTRSVHDASGLMQRSEKAGWGLVALDAPVDTTSPSGRAMAQISQCFRRTRATVDRGENQSRPGRQTRPGCCAWQAPDAPRQGRQAHRQRARRGPYMDGHCRGDERRPGSHSPGRVALVSGHGPVRGEFREATRLRPGVGLDVGQITDHVIAYREGHITFETLCVFLADFTYEPCPPLGIWQMWGGGHALDDTKQEMHIATAQLPDDEFLALMKAVESRWHSVHERGDGDDDGDGCQATAEWT